MKGWIIIQTYNDKFTITLLRVQVKLPYLKVGVVFRDAKEETSKGRMCLES